MLNLNLTLDNESAKLLFQFLNGARIEAYRAIGEAASIGDDDALKAGEAAEREQETTEDTHKIHRATKTAAAVGRLLAPFREHEKALRA